MKALQFRRKPAKYAAAAAHWIPAGASLLGASSAGTLLGGNWGAEPANTTSSSTPIASSRPMDSGAGRNVYSGSEAK